MKNELLAIGEMVNLYFMEASPDTPFNVIPADSTGILQELQRRVRVALLTWQQRAYWWFGEKHKAVLQSQNLLALAQLQYQLRDYILVRYPDTGILLPEEAKREPLLLPFLHATENLLRHLENQFPSTAERDTLIPLVCLQQFITVVHKGQGALRKTLRGAAIPSILITAVMRPYDNIINAPVGGLMAAGRVLLLMALFDTLRENLNYINLAGNKTYLIRQLIYYNVNNEEILEAITTYLKEDIYAQTEPEQRLGVARKYAALFSNIRCRNTAVCYDFTFPDLASLVNAFLAEEVANIDGDIKRLSQSTFTLDIKDITKIETELTPQEIGFFIALCSEVNIYANNNKTKLIKMVALLTGQAFSTLYNAFYTVSPATRKSVRYRIVMMLSFLDGHIVGKTLNRKNVV